GILFPVPNWLWTARFLPESTKANTIRSNTQSLTLPFPRQLVIEDHAAYKHRRKHIRQQADHQCDRKASHGSGYEQEQESARDDGGDVSVHNRPPGFAESRVHG